LSYDGITIGLRWHYRWNYDGTTMAQASTLVPITKMKKAQAWTLALSWGLYKIHDKSCGVMHFIA
jgi:hypothetical protein